MFCTSGELRRLVAAWAGAFDAALIDPAAARDVVREWSAIEGIAATVKAMAATRVDCEGTGRRSPADWLASETGTTSVRAREQLATGTRLLGLDDTAAAAKRGDLSAEQAAAIADAATADPSAERKLLDAAQEESLGELRTRCGRAKANADPDPDATYRRIHTERRLRRWTAPDGAGHLAGNGPLDRLALLDSALAPIIERLFAAARREGRHESRDAYAFDALIELAEAAARGGDVTPSPPRPAASAPDEASPPPDPPAASATEPARRSGRPATRYRAVIRVDHSALVRGWTLGDEVCEIAGLGPVPASRVRQLLGEATLHLVLTKGADVANVTYLGRGPSAAQRVALLWSMPRCTVLGCACRHQLQYDHRDPYAAQPVTELRNLDPLCPWNHRLKTLHGWALVNGTGPRRLVPPEHPDHPKNRPKQPAA